MSQEYPYYKQSYDLTNCDKEPIQSIMRCQGYGDLLVISLDCSKWYFASHGIINEIRTANNPITFLENRGLDLQQISCPIGGSETVTADEVYLVHRKKDVWIIEIEPALVRSDISISDEDYQQSVLALSRSLEEHKFYQAVVDEIYRITGYDHIMIYQFDQDYNGDIIEERKIESRPSYKGMKFPAEDIPPQARHLFLTEQVRIIFDIAGDQVLYENPGSPDLDLTGVAIRGVSPIHQEYLSNMGVAASFSVAIIKDEKLWGLIACHHTKPRLIHHQARAWLKFFSSLISINLDKLHQHKQEVSTIEDVLMEEHLVGNLQGSQDLVKSLLHQDQNMMDLIHSDGAVIFFGDEIECIGSTPDIQKLASLKQWLIEQGFKEGQSWSSTKQLMPEKLYDVRMAGILALRLSPMSEDFLVWLRKERIQTISWGGNPNKHKSFDENVGRLVPRRSFEIWNEEVADTCEPWTMSEKSVARSFLDSLRNKLFEQYNQVLLLNRDLKAAYNQMETFSYILSHDLKAPLRSIEGFANILKDDYGAALDQHGLRLLDIITRSIEEMRTLIHEILDYNKLNKQELRIAEVDLGELLEASWARTGVSTATFHIEPRTPRAFVDKVLISQVFNNLFSNAMKYVDENVQPIIHVWHEQKESYVDIFVEDNGIGIEKDQRQKVFEEFQRLHAKKYDGSGLGLSIVKRIVARHGGEVEIMDSQRHHTGTIFRISLPSQENIKDVISSRIIH